MSQVRVLVVDDSITMRALFSGVLNDAPGVTVVDHAASAAEARDLIKRLHPDVVTLDVEMPGMSGIDFLREIMATKPIPVIMLSTLTQKGSAATLEALEIGAYDCFPKPMVATMEEFKKIGPRLAKLVKAAASGKAVRVKDREGGALVDGGYVPGDSLAVILGNTGAHEALADLLARFPVNCPPMLVHLPSAHGYIDALVEKLDKVAAPTVRAAYDGQKIIAGNVYVIHDPAKHAVVDRWPDATLRLIDGEPIAGHRPSANLLVGSVAKTAGARGAVAALSGIGDDGLTAMGGLAAIGGLALALPEADAKAGELPRLAVALAGATALASGDLGRALLQHQTACPIAA